jgi:hypothetical protein
MRFSKALWVALIALLVTSTAWAQGKNPEPTKAGDKTDAAATNTAKSGDNGGTAKAGDSKAGDTKAADTKAADTKAADTKAGDSAAAAGASASAAAKPPIDGSTYVVRLRDLEQRVDELKEQIRRSHTRLSLLSDTILSGGVGGARAEIKFTNDMSNAFRLTRALFVLDGAVQYNKQDDSGALAAQKEIPIFSGSIPPGDHTLQVLVQLQGHGYGVFSYLRGYHFEVKSSHSFTVTEGKTISLEAIAWEKGGVTTPLEQRPAVRYVEKITSGMSSAGGASGSSSKSSSGASGHLSVGTGGK